LFSDILVKKSTAVLARCHEAGLTIATAESCTGGLIAACLTDLPGASAVFERGFVTYANQAKTDLLGVPADLIREHGAVSEPVARAMAAGALARSPADLAISVTGIAGPGGATPEKPVGLVFIGRARRGAEAAAERHVFGGNREAIRAAAAAAALDALAAMAEEARA